MTTEKPMQRVVDADHPWLGLTPFTPQTKEYFFGRDREIRDLFLRTREQPLTILYSQSGLGKTSLLGAGLIPKLEVEGYRPCLIRLGYEASDLPLLDQTIAAIRRTLASTSTFSSEVSLWEFFHHLNFRPKSLEEHPPVIIFDQFEEIFTLTETPQRQRESQEFFRQLADLVENRPPQSVQDELRENRRKARDYDLSSSSVRVVITLREDFLSQLEAWKKQLPSLMRNRVGLRQLDGPQALEAVVRPGRREGRNLVSDDVAAAIVRFVAKKPIDTPLEEIGAVPPLLSLLCDELNESRLVAKSAMITAQQVQSQSSDILQNFYLRSFDNLSQAVRVYVEDRLVTVGGHRNPVAREDAVSDLASQGVPNASDAIDQLIQGRLLNAEERGGVQRLEITHDVIAPLVVHSRDARRVRERAEKAEREQEESRRQRRRLQRIAGAMIGLTLLALSGTAFAIYSTYQAKSQKRIAESARTEAEQARKAAELAEGKAIRSLDDLTEQSKQAATVLFDYGESEFAAGRFSSSAEKLERAWRLRSEEDPLKRYYALTIVNRMSLDHRSFVLRHSVSASCLAFSPDGRSVATLSNDKTAGIWDASSGAPIGQPMRHEDSVRCLSFSPDGKRFATGSDDKTARIWDASSGAPIGQPMRHEDTMQDQLRPKPFDRVADAIGRPTIQDRLRPKSSLDPVADALAITRLELDAIAATAQRNNQLGRVHFLAFSPDGKRVATGCDDKAVRIWDASSVAPIVFRNLLRDGVCCLAFSPDGTRIATNLDDNAAQIWDAFSGDRIGRPMQHEKNIRCLSFSPDGMRVATGSLDKTVRIWNSSTGTPIVEPIRHEHNVHSLAFSPDGARIATGSDVANIWDASSGVRIGQPMRHDLGVLSVVFSPDGTRLATGSSHGTARLWELSNGAIGQPIQNRPWERQKLDFIAFGPDGLVTTPTPLAFSPDRKRVATKSDDRTARIWDASSGAPIGEPLRHEDSVNCLAFSPDGTRVATGSDDETARLWDVSSGAPIGRPMHHGTYIVSDAHILSVAFSPDGKRVATGSDDKTACIWNASSGAPIGEPMRHEDSVRCLAFSPDMTRVATGSDDKTARIWDASSGAPIGQPMRHEDRVRSVAFSPDGKRVATGSDDRTARVWDASSGAPIGQPMRHNAHILSVAFSPDGRRVATESGDRTARLWDADFALPNSIEAYLNRFAKEYNPSIPRDREFEAAVEAKRVTELLRYRKSTVAKAMLESNWFAVIYHLQALMKEEPDELQWKVMWQQTQLNSKAEKGEWNQALEHSQRRLELEPSAHAFDDCLLCTLGTNDSVKLQSFVKQYLQFAEASDAPIVWNQIGWISTCCNNESMPWVGINRLAAKAVESNAKSWEYRETLGGTLYRLKRFDEAKAELNRSLELSFAEANEKRKSIPSVPVSPQASSKPDSAKPADAPNKSPVVGTFYLHAFLAMTYHQLKEPEKSKEQRTLMDRIEKEQPTKDWQELLRRRLLVDEVRTTCNAN